MSEKQQAVGSVWNVNSWHWEQKNYTTQAKKILEDIVLKISIEQEGLTVVNSHIKSIEGDAEINVRKGKQILCYEFNLEVEFKGIFTLFRMQCIHNIFQSAFIIQHSLILLIIKWHKANKGDDQADGYFKIHDINPDDLDFEVDHVTLNTKGSCGDAAKKLIQKRMKEELKKHLKDFSKLIAENENQPTKIKEDEEKRLYNQEQTQKAREEKGKEKDAIFKEQKESEKLMKQQFSQWNNN